MRSAFLFGKLPAHGDFIRRGISEAVAEELDDYLSGSLGDAATLEDFDDLYASAPAWRFVADVGGQAMCGVIAPSVDKVGRQFPIVAGIAVPRNGLGVAVDACEAVLYDAFSQGMTADALIGALEDFPGEAAADEAPPYGWFLEDEDKVVVARLDGSRPPRLMRRMMESARLRS